MSESIVASNVGITEAGQSLLSYSNELSGLFDNVAQVTDSLEANVTGFESIENLILQLKNINSTKDSLISKIKEFGDYLINTVAPGYGGFEENIANIDVDLSSLDTLIAMLSGSAVGGNTFDSEGITDETTEGTTGGTTEETTKETTEGTGTQTSGTTRQITESEARKTLQELQQKSNSSQAAEFKDGMWYVYDPHHEGKPDGVPYDTWLWYTDGRYVGKAYWPSDDIDSDMFV